MANVEARHYERAIEILYERMNGIGRDVLDEVKNVAVNLARAESKGKQNE